MEYFIDSGDRALSKIPMVSVFFLFLFLLIAIEITIQAIDNITYQLLTESKKKKNGRSDQYSIQDREWYKNLMKG
jgi:cytochrome c oxidase cbb3-type subunit 3